MKLYECFYQLRNMGHTKSLLRTYLLQQKMGVWEGSVRTAAFVWSSLIQNNYKVFPGLIHVADWLPTLLSVAGI